MLCIIYWRKYGGGKEQREKKCRCCRREQTKPEGGNCRYYYYYYYYSENEESGWWKKKKKRDEKKRKLEERRENQRRSKDSTVTGNLHRRREKCIITASSCRSRRQQQPLKLLLLVGCAAIFFPAAETVKVKSRPVKRQFCSYSAPNIEIDDSGGAVQIRKGHDEKSTQSSHQSGGVNSHTSPVVAQPTQEERITRTSLAQSGKRKFIETPDSLALQKYEKRKMVINETCDRYRKRTKTDEEKKAENEKRKEEIKKITANLTPGGSALKKKFRKILSRTKETTQDEVQRVLQTTIKNLEWKSDDIETVTTGLNTLRKGGAKVAEENAAKLAHVWDRGGVIEESNERLLGYCKKSAIYVDRLYDKCFLAIKDIFNILVEDEGDTFRLDCLCDLEDSKEAFKTIEKLQLPIEFQRQVLSGFKPKFYTEAWYTQNGLEQTDLNFIPAMNFLRKSYSFFSHVILDAWLTKYVETHKNTAAEVEEMLINLAKTLGGDNFTNEVSPEKLNVELQKVLFKVQSKIEGKPEILYDPTEGILNTYSGNVKHHYYAFAIYHLESAVMNSDLWKDEENQYNHVRDTIVNTFEQIDEQGEKGEDEQKDAAMPAENSQPAVLVFDKERDSVASDNHYNKNQLVDNVRGNDLKYAVGSYLILLKTQFVYEYYDVFKALYKSTADIDMIRGLKEHPPRIPGKFAASQSEWRFLKSFFDVTIKDINDALNNAKFKETEVAAATPFPKKQEREDTMGNQIKNFPHILPVNWRKCVHKASEPIQGNPESSQLASKWTRIPGVVSFLPFLTVICVFMAWVAFRFLHHHKHCCGSPVIAK